MTGALQRLLTDDHARLDALLARAAQQPGVIERAPYDEFRAGILKHIGIEEKILLPTAKRLRGGEPLAVAKLLKVDHSAIAALLVLTPSVEVVARIRAVLALHNPLEEGPAGLYAECERLAASELDAVMERVRAAPEVPLMPYSDGERAHRNAAHWLAQVEAARAAG